MPRSPFLRTIAAYSRIAGAALGSIMPTIITAHIAKVMTNMPPADIGAMSAMPVIIAASRHR